MTDQQEEDWYYRTFPVEGAPGWEVTQTNRRSHVTVGCNPPTASGYGRRTSIEDIEFDQDGDISITIDAPSEGSCGVYVPSGVLIAMLRLAGYTVTPP